MHACWLAGWQSRGQHNRPPPTVGQVQCHDAVVGLQQRGVHLQARWQARWQAGRQAGRQAGTHDVRQGVSCAAGSAC